jgi:hypothetical protein
MVNSTYTTSAHSGEYIQPTIAEELRTLYFPVLEAQLERLEKKIEEIQKLVDQMHTILAQVKEIENDNQV